MPLDIDLLPLELVFVYFNYKTLLLPSQIPASSLFFLKNKNDYSLHIDPINIFLFLMNLTSCSSPELYLEFEMACGMEYPKVLEEVIDTNLTLWLIRIEECRDKADREYKIHSQNS